MNKGQLIEALNKFVEEQDDEVQDEFYGTKHDMAEDVMAEFRNWLIDNKYI